VELYDNDATWLDFADLVFVDPVGTGFSRPTKPEYAAEFLNTLGDLASTAEFIRLYLTRFDLLNTPVFLAGESYGTWRASGAAEALEKKGVRVAGVILISGGVQMGKVSPDAIRTALFVASRTATAFYHKKLAPELLRDEKATLDEARKWAMTEYAPAWDRRDSLSDADREKTAMQLARYTGVDPSAIDRKTLMMSSPQFTSTLLRDRNLTLGRYDMRITQPAGAVAAALAPRERGIRNARVGHDELHPKRSRVQNRSHLPGHRERLCSSRSRRPRRRRPVGMEPGDDHDELGRSVSHACRRRVGWLGRRTAGRQSTVAAPRNGPRSQDHRVRGSRTL
jgi:surfactin synthase thioesterase subunit